MEKQLAEIYFKFEVYTKFYENVRICGNKKDLGNWNPINSLKLETNDKEFPIWFNKDPFIIPFGSLLNILNNLIK